MDLTRRSMLGAAVASLASGSLAAPTRSVGASAQSRFRAAIADAAQTAIAGLGAPGISVAIARHGKIQLEQGFGLASLETASPVTPRTVFRIGSLTKQFTAAAALLLQERGQLRLDDPVSKYFPIFAAHPRIAIAELINHTAGLHSEDEETSGPVGPDGPPSQVVLANAIAAQKTLFDFPPGTAWLYSNANYLLLGAIVEAVSGTPLASALYELVLKRLAQTTLALDRSDIVVRNRANGYSVGDDGRFSHATFIEISNAGGAGAMRGSAVDLVRWHQALIGGKVMSEASFAFLTTAGRLRDGRLGGANRFSPDDSNYGDVQYGGGLLLSPVGSRPRTISHNGFINGFSAVLETNLDTGLSFAVLANADVGPKLPFRAIRKAVRDLETQIPA